MNFKEFFQRCSLIIKDLEMDSETVGSNIALIQRFFLIFLGCLGKGKRDQEYKIQITGVLDRLDSVRQKILRRSATPDNKIKILSPPDNLNEREIEGEKDLDYKLPFAIRTDCYLAVLQKFQNKYPHALFEVITRTSNHILSPSWKLLKKYKNEKWPFEEYKKRFLSELLRPENKKAQAKLDELTEIAKHQNIYLVCYESDPTFCHRNIIKELVVDNLKGYYKSRYDEQIENDKLLTPTNVYFTKRNLPEEKVDFNLKILNKMNLTQLKVVKTNIENEINKKNRKIINSRRNKL